MIQKNSALLIITAFLLIFNACGFGQDLNPFKNSKIKFLRYEKNSKNVDSQLAKACEGWKLERKQFSRLVKKANIITPEQMQSFYYRVKCYYEGEILIDGAKFSIEVNGGGFSVIYNDEKTLYLAFPRKLSKKYFLMPPED